MLKQVAVLSFTIVRNLFMYPVTILAAVTAITCFIRLIHTVIFKNSIESEPWGFKSLSFCVGMIILLSVCDPDVFFPKKWAFFICAAWFFSMVCLLEIEKILSQKSWREIFKVIHIIASKVPKIISKGTVKMADCTKRTLVLYLEKDSNRSPESRESILFCQFILTTIFFLNSLLIAGIYPKIVYALLLIFWMFSFFWQLCRCLLAHRSFVKFWLSHALYVVLYLAAILGDALPNDIQSVPLAYGCTCVVFVLLWCWSAVIADQEAVKMAGRVLNTLTILLLLGTNIFLRQYGDLRNTIDLVLLPIVAASCLSVLFANWIARSRKRYMPQETAAIEPEDVTEQKIEN